MKRSLFPVALLIALACAAPARPCSLCGSLRDQPTLRQDVEQAAVVLFGTAANPRFNDGPGAAPGSGSTEFNITAVLKSPAGYAAPKQITLPGYIPVIDVKNPPKFVIFCDVKDGKLVVGRGRSVRSDAVLQYLADAQAVQGKDRIAALVFYFKYLDHADDTVSHDAFLEYARSTDQEVGQVAKLLPPDKIRALLQNPKTPSERVGLYAFLLGVVGTEKDADFLKGLIEQPTERNTNALDGLLSGYISLRGQAGWDLAFTLLADGKRPFGVRFAVARTLRFYQAWQPAVAKPQILRGLEVMVKDSDLADMGIEDLRRFKLWEHTGLVLSKYEQPGYKTPIIRNAIVRYALACPQPQAAQFAAALRKVDPDLVRDAEEGLELEK